MNMLGFASDGARRARKRAAAASALFTIPIPLPSKHDPRFAELEADQQTFLAALDCMETAVFVLAAPGSICKCNKAASALLAKADGLIASRGRLVATSPKVDGQFAELVRAALTGKGGRSKAVALPRQIGSRPLLARIVPFVHKRPGLPSDVTAYAIIFVSDPDVDVFNGTDEVMDAYGLTASEKKLVRELLAGQSLAEAALNLNITRLTSRNRLSRIMDKTGTRRQADLLQLILRSRVPVL